MYLKSLTLKGFKSFADRTRMVFDPGLTVVVGPNGSGKSNISDSILWVLGEQSAKHLRGQAMEDVVFAGSSARKPVGVAEVDLVLDNSDHTLPVDFDEVAITRRMYRSGESEYLINGAPSRLLDIQDILHDSGMGKETHSIISQGKLDAILMSRPEERRSLIEEAAGISKHKRRKERSVRKLQAMDQHLQRALDHQKEVKRQLRPLERQVERAQRYNELSGRAGELSVSLAVDDLRRLQRQWAEVEVREREANAQLELADYQLKERQKELEKLQTMLEEKGLFVGDLSEQRRRCASACERVEAGLRLLEEKGRNMVARLAEARDTARTREARRTECARELEETRAEGQRTHGELQALMERQTRAQLRTREVRAQRRTVEDKLAQANGRSRARSRERDTATVELAKAKDVLENARVADDMFASRLSQIDEAIAAAERDAEQAAAACDEADAAVEAARAEQAAAAQRAQQAREAQAAGAAQVQQAREALAGAQRAEREARSVLSALQAEIGGLERAATGAENREPLAARLAGDERVRQATRSRVSEALIVPDELSELVETLLAQEMTGFVVGDAEGLSQIARAARAVSGATGRVSVVRGSADEAEPGDSNEAGLPGYALTNRIGDVEGLPGVARALLGEVRVVDDLDAALAASVADPGHLYATPVGDTVRAGRVACVGQGSGAGHGLLASRARLRELRGEVPARQASVEIAATALAQADTALEEARRAQDVLAAEVARLSGEASQASSEVARLAAEAQRCRTQRDRLAGEGQRSRTERERVCAQRAQAAERAEAARGQVDVRTKELATAEEDLATLSEQIARLNERVDDVRREDRAAHEEENTCQVDLARCRERDRYLESRVSALASELADVTRGLEGARESMRSLEAMRLRVAPLRERYVALQEHAQSWAARLRDRASLAEADSASLKKTIEDARSSVAQAQRSHTQAITATGDVKAAKSRLDVQVNAAINAITSHEGVILEDALQLPESQERAADEAELARLQRAITDIGPVNQVAFEQYTSLRQHADYVDAQVEDLQHARGALTKILVAIDRKMKNGFVATFEAVDRNFQEIFGLLFPGGAGHLEMTDPDNPTETGIEVIAQPRGKRVGKMSLLSGGERSLTALGLLFAVYTTRTVPFYVLDEVEAALDDSNLDRLLDAIERLRRRTQLIVISHQRRTMERADVLYGVSMQADGVSRVISQRIGEATSATAGKA